MTRKHFDAIARILAADFAVANGAQKMTVRTITLSMADYFVSENPNFSRERFYRAVGLDEGGYLPASALLAYSEERKARKAG
ncbi:MAG: hypothetical protein ABIQ39_02090 [Ilumatobacteraceae bacterium]